MANIDMPHGRALRIPRVSPRATDKADARFEHSVWAYRLMLPFMFLIALYVHAKKTVLGALNVPVHLNSMIVDGISINSRRVKEGSARWPALNACYTFTRGEGSNALVRSIDKWWMCVRNAQAVRNRLKIVKSELHAAIVEASRVAGSDPIRILSLAAGTAQGVIEVVAAKRREGYRFQLILVDRDASALRYASQLAQQHGIADILEVKVGDVIRFDKITRDFHPHIVEMCGLMDYLRDSLAIGLVKIIRREMAKGGIFLTCHVHPNGEEYFLRHVVDWDMLYRPLTAFQNVLDSSGFLNARYETEPHGIHSVAVCRKD